MRMSSTNSRAYSEILSGVREGPGRVLGLRQLDALLQGVAAEDRGHLLAGDRGLRVELRGGDALDDALVLGPRDVGLGPVALAVLKRMLALVGLERFGVREGAGQQLDELGAGELALRLVGRGGHAVDDAAVDEVVDVVVIPRFLGRRP